MRKHRYTQFRIGIPKDMIDEFLRRIYKLDATHVNQEGGTGVDLHTSKQ
jgi:signal transduction histidine kinase